eukprot:scaffold210961_cov23-Prasinocladus_malaysianus.AAC.1
MGSTHYYVSNCREFWEQRVQCWNIKGAKTSSYTAIKECFECPMRMTITHLLCITEGAKVKLAGRFGSAQSNCSMGSEYHQTWQEQIFWAR